MNVRTYRLVRAVVGGLVLMGCALAFADIGDWLEAGMVRAVVWLQFAPSLSGLLTGGGWLAAGCIVVLVLTVCFGRVYCAMLCPLGVLMDLSASIAGRTGKKRRLPHDGGHPWVRGAVLAVCAVGLIAGTAVPLALLEPYSVFGKITSGVLRPVLGAANQLLASAAWITPVKVSPVAWTMAGVAVVLLVLVVLAAVFRGRLWCNAVCPVGTVFGFLSKFAWFRLRIADAACSGCSMCERVCPAQCIDFRNHTIDHSRCVMCLDCVTFCKRSGIQLEARSVPGKRPDGVPGGNSPPEANPAASGGEVDACTAVVVTPTPGLQGGETNPNRREFLASIAVLPAAALAAQQSEHPAHQNRRAVLPPGAGSLERFQNLCTACQLCVANCPEQVLRPSITQHGLAGFLQPYQDFGISFCSYNCSNCSQVCPTGAISPITVEERRLVRAGVAEFIPDLCIVKTAGTSCGACNEHCPTQAVHMVPYEKGLTIPKVEPALCIGCGGCEFICPVRPRRAIVVNGIPVHERAQPLDLGQKNTVREAAEEFPF